MKTIIFTHVRPKEDPEWRLTMGIDGLPPLDQRIPMIYGKNDDTRILTGGVEKAIILTAQFINYAQLG